MSWGFIIIKKARNGCAIEVIYSSGGSSRWVVEGDEEKLIEVLKYVITGQDTESSG